MASPQDEIFEPDIDPAERGSLTKLMNRLEGERPLPSPAFRGNLRRSVLRDRARGPEVPRLRRLALSCAASGTFLFAVAVAGVSGLGPLAAG